MKGHAFACQRGLVDAHRFQVFGFVLGNWAGLGWAGLKGISVFCGQRCVGSGVMGFLCMLLLACFSFPNYDIRCAWRAYIHTLRGS